MIVTKDTNYGADAEGNRGITMYFYEIEESDRDEIVAQLEEDEDTSTIYLECPYTGNSIEFDVDREEYLE